MANDVPISRSKQWIIIAAGLCVALGAMVVAATYQADTTPAELVLSGSPVDGGGIRADDPNAEATPLDVNPIEAWLPTSGEGAACSEAVGVDLIPGFGAVLTINGRLLSEDQMNGVDEATGAIPASRSLGQFTYGPEEDCPNGELLRPQNNRVEACIYRLTEGPEGCRTYPAFTFDAL